VLSSAEMACDDKLARAVTAVAMPVDSRASRASRRMKGELPRSAEYITAEVLRFMTSGAHRLRESSRAVWVSTCSLRVVARPHLDKPPEAALSATMSVT
jgi:hypothetical protein